jgi:DNA-binding response OmpR family regulator
MFKIGLIEDNETFGYILKEYLEMHDYIVFWEKTGEAGIDMVLQNTIDLCVLDITLPKMDGFEVARQIKKTVPGLPFIFLTARSLKIDKLKGFRLGADDYLTKPIDEELLLAHIRAIINRTSKSQPLGSANYQIGQYQFNPRNQTLEAAEDRVKLTQMESELLMMLYTNKGQLMDRALALKTIWGSTDEFSRKSMDVFISRLRKHLSADQSIRIENVHGKGFILHC